MSGVREHGWFWVWGFRGAASVSNLGNRALTPEPESYIVRTAA